MALKFVLDSIDEVDEALRALYEEKDGKFYLGVEGVVPEDDVAGLKSAVAKERAAREAAEKKLKGSSNPPKKEDGGTSAHGLTEEEIAELVAEREARRVADAEKKGEWDKLRQQMTERHQREIAAKEAAIKAAEDKAEGFRNRLIGYVKRAEATSSIAKYKGSEVLLRGHVESAIKVDLNDDGSVSTAVVDNKGDPRVNVKGEPLTLDEFVGEMQTNEVFGRAFEGSGSAGSGARPGGKPPVHNVNRRSDLKDEHARSEFIDKHGLEAYQRLPM